MITCSTPISWLVLERHHLGELDATEALAVATHVRACSACQALVERIAADDRALPPLELAPPRAHAAQLRRPWYVARPRTTAIAAGLALAAGVVLTIGRNRAIDDDRVPTARSKGTEISLTLVREDEGVVSEAGGAYRDGERFKALVSCAPGTKVSFDLAVFERGEVSFPLAAASELECGNAVPIAGAFRVTGRERMVVCLVWQLKGEGAIDREVVRRTPPDLLRNARCTLLEPAH